MQIDFGEFLKYFTDLHHREGATAFDVIVKDWMMRAKAARS